MARKHKQVELGEIIKMAEAGDPEAQIELGARYYHGQGVQKDLEKYFEWVKKAADQDYGLGLYYTGCAYLSGDGVKVDK